MDKTEHERASVETQATRIFDLIWEIWSYKGPSVRQFIQEKIRPIPKKYLWALFRIVLISFIPSIILIGLGFFMNSRWLLFFGGLWRAACSVLLLVAITPVGLIIEVIRGGTEGSGKRWAEIISGTFIGELFFTIVIMILLPRLKGNIEMLPLLLMASIILGMAGGAFFGRGFIGVTTGIIAVAVTVTIVFPGPINRFLGELDDKNMLEHFMISLDELNKGEVVFFNLDGSPRAWYYLDEKAKCLELFTRKGYHPVADVKLQPLDKKFVEIIIETKGRCLHPANIRKPSSQTDLQSNKYAEHENRKISQKDTPVSPSSANYQQLDISQPWKFRWEKFPGYPGYEHGAFSKWVPAKIEQTDDDIKIALLDKNEGVIATFSGKRKSNGTFAGSWLLADQSGRGAFIINAVGTGSIEGTMQDKTIDPRFIKFKLVASSDIQTKTHSTGKRIGNKHSHGTVTNTDKKRNLARALRPDSNEPKRAIVSTPKSEPQVSPVPEFTVTPTAKPTTAIKSTRVESRSETDLQPSPKKSKEEEKEEEILRRAADMAWPYNK